MSNLPDNHEPVTSTTPMAPNTRTARLGVQALSFFFANHAWLSLFTLLIFGGVAVGLSRAWSHKPDLQPPAASSSKEPGTRGVDAVATTAFCAQLVVHLQGAASVRELGQLLRSLNSTIVFGPDENGAYRLRMEPNDVDANRSALELSAAVLSTEVLARCP